MRCYCCNMDLQDGHDPKTDRYYCYECMEPTNQLHIHQLEAELENLFGLPTELPDLEELDLESEQVDAVDEGTT